MQVIFKQSDDLVVFRGGWRHLDHNTIDQLDLRIARKRSSECGMLPISATGPPY